MTRFRLRSVGSAIWLCFAFGTLRAGQVDTVFIPASRDVTLYEDSLGFLANGAGQYFFTGRTDSAESGLRRRALIHFNIAAHVPAGAYIADAAMTLHMSQGGADSQLVGVHRILSMWQEGPSDPPAGEESGVPPDTGDVTWIHCRFPTSQWATPGGVFDPIAADTEWVADEGFCTWTSMYMAAEVQVWLDTPTVNVGWALVGGESETNTIKRFDSREHSTSANQPVLMVIYATPTWTTILAESDNTLYEHPFGSLSNGAGEAMFSGRTSDSSNSVRRGLVKFALFDSISHGAQVFDARLLLSVTDAPATHQAVSVHKVSRSWVEGTSDASGTEEQGALASGGGATWLRYDTNCGGCNWSVPGGAFATLPVATTVVVDTAGRYEWRSDSLTEAVQAWAGGIANHGFLLKGDESQAGTLVRFGTREQVDPSRRPVLQVVWSASNGCVIPLKGDANLSGTVTSGDIIHLVNYVFKSGEPPRPCLAAGDINCSGTVTSADIIALLMFVFKGGAPPCDMCLNSPLGSFCTTAAARSLR